MSKTVGCSISEMYMQHSLRHTAPAERVGEPPNIFLLEKAFALILLIPGRGLCSSCLAVSLHSQGTKGMDKATICGCFIEK